MSLLFLRRRDGGFRRVPPEVTEAKNYPVNGFSVPRAGIGTAPVPGGIPPSPPNKMRHAGAFLFGLGIRA